jgi:excisionase family DNA binding protein
MTESRSRRASKPAPEELRAPGGRDEFLTPTQVADRLLVAPVTVRLWASKGLLPSVTTLGGHRRFRALDVDEFVSKHQHLTTNDSRKPSRILIIDDDEQFARYLKGLLSTSAPGAFVDVADNGFAAGIKCQAMRPDVVTLDLMMPDMNGFEVCALLRTMFGRDKPYIVALTGFASRENTDRIVAAGANSCVPKTAPAKVLLEKLGVKYVRKR